MIIPCLVLLTVLLVAFTFAHRLEFITRKMKPSALRRGLAVSGAIAAMVVVGVLVSQRVSAGSGNDFGNVPLNTPLVTQLITVHGTDGTTMDTLSVWSGGVVFTGGASVDYLDEGVGTTCVSGFTFNSGNGDSCVVDVGFQPLAVGRRNGAVEVSGAGVVLGVTYVTGTGTGQQTSFSPGTITGPQSFTSFVNIQDGVLDAKGNAYVVANDQIREVNADGSNNGVNTTIISGQSGSTGFTDGAALNARYNDTSGIAIDPIGNLYIADTGNNAIRKISHATTVPGAVTTIAGGPGMTGLDGGPANLAKLVAPHGVALDGAGNIYIADSGEFRIRKIDALTGVISTVTGNGTSGFAGDGGLASDPAAEIGDSSAIAVDGAGNIFFSDISANIVREVNAASGKISTFAGTPHRSGFSGDGALATAAKLNTPAGITIDAGGDVYIADSGNASVRRVDAAGIITTIAGNGATGTTVFGGSATGTPLGNPVGLAFDANLNPSSPNGNLHIFDSANSTVDLVNGVAVPTFAFGSVAQNRFSATQSVTVENSGTDAVTFTSASADPGFTVFGTSSCETGGGVTLTAGQTCKVDVAASPGSSQAAGTPYTGNLTITTSIATTVVALTATATGEPTHLAFVTAPLATVAAGGTASVAGTPVTVQELDGANAATNSPGDTVVLTVTGPNSYSATYSSTSDATGLASFDLSGVPLTIGGQYSYVASVAPSAPKGAIISTPPAVETVTTGPATKFVTSAIPATVAAGGNLGTVTATIEDANGSTVTSSTAAVQVAISGPTGFTFTPVTVNAVSGVATFNLTGTPLNQTGSYTVTFSSTGLTAPAASTVTVSVGTATQFVVSAIPATLPAGGNLGTITATIEDAGGNTITTSTAPVSVVVTGPTGFAGFTLGPNRAVAGVATFDFTAHPFNRPGAYTLTFSSTGLTGPAPATVTVNVGTASNIALAAPIPTPIAEGGNLGMFTAKITDAGGNLVTTATNPVTVTVTGPVGFTLAPVTVNAVAGFARFDLSGTALTIAGTYTVTLSSPGLTSSVSTVTVNPGAAAKFIVSAVPATVTIGGNLGNITATIQDAAGNTVTSSSATVVVNIAGPGGFSNGGAATATNGVAIINLSGIPLNTPGTYTVTFSSAGLTAPAAATVTVTAGAAAKFIVSAVPTPIVVGGNLGTITATIQDAGGNTVTTSTAPVTVSIAGPTGFTFAPVTVSAISGVATFNLTGTPLNVIGTYTVTFSSAGLTGPAASTVTVTAGPAAKFIVSAVPTPINIGGNLGMITATIEDAGGNTVATSTAPVTVSIVGPTGFTFTPLTVSAVNGVATFNLSGTPLTVPGTYMVTFSSPGLTGPAASTVMVIGQVATTTVVTSSGSPSAEGGNVTFTATVTGSGAGTPTGTVTFFDGTTMLGTGTLDATGATTFQTSTLALGTHSITAVYGGDANFLGSTSAAFNQVVAAAFTISVNPSSITLHSGDKGFFAVNVTGNAGFSGNVSLSCSNLPNTMQCVFFPSTVGAGSGGSQTAEMVLRTQGVFNRPTASLQRNGTGTGNSDAPIFPALAFFLPGAALSAFGLRRKGMDGRKRNALLLVIVMLGMGGMLGLSGCGSGTGPHTPAGTYNINVVGTSGTLVSSAPVTVVIK